MSFLLNLRIFKFAQVHTIISQALNDVLGLGIQHRMRCVCGISHPEGFAVALRDHLIYVDDAAVDNLSL